MKKKNKKLLLVMSLIASIGLSGLSYSLNNVQEYKSSINVLTRKSGRLNTENKEASLNAVGEIALEVLDLYVNADLYGVERIREIKDFDNNTYVLVEFNPVGYLIYNVSNGDIVECAPTSVSPYKNTNVNELYFLPMVGYFAKSAGQYTNIMEKEIIDNEKLLKYKNESRRYHESALKTLDEANIERTRVGTEKQVRRSRKNVTVTNHDYFTTTVTADVEVPYSWYFKKNYNHFAAQSTGCCGYIGIGMLLSYCEIFLCKGYFSNYQSSSFVTQYFGSELGEGVPRVNDYFLYELTENPGGATRSELVNAIYDFLEDKTVYYTVEETVGLFTDITKPINDGYPAVYLGTMPDFEGGVGSHAVIVYGTYSNGSVLCHYGWPGYSQVIMSSLGLFEKAGTISIYNHSNHFHHAYFMLNGTPYCGCGLELMC